MTGIGRGRRLAHRLATHFYQIVNMLRQNPAGCRQSRKFAQTMASQCMRSDTKITQNTGQPKTQCRQSRLGHIGQGQLSLGTRFRNVIPEMRWINL